MSRVKTDFLISPGVGSSPDHAETPFEAQHDERRRPRSVGGLVGLERGGADEGEIRHVLSVCLVVCKRLEHVAGEQAVPGELGHDADRRAVLGLRVDGAVLHEQVAALEEAEHPAPELVELLGADRAVVLAPLDLVLGCRLAHDELVLGRARRLLAGREDDRAVPGDPALSTERDLLVERLGGQVPVGAAKVGEAVVVEPVLARQLGGLGLCRGDDVERVEGHSQSLTSRWSPM